MEERRGVTALFADMQGFTAASEKADPEVVADTLKLCFTRLGEEIDRYGGTVDKVMGDAIMALFGAPVAHDDDPRRAIEGALGMQTAMEELQPQIEERLGTVRNLAKWQVPSECLVLEDSPNGVRAGVSAGMNVVAVATPFTSAALHSSRVLEHAWVVHDPEELVEVMERRIAAHNRIAHP